MVAASCPRAGLVRRRARRSAAALIERHGGAACQQPDGQQPGGRDEDEQARGHRAGADERRREWRGNAADEQVLHGVDVAHQPGQQVAGPERAQPGWRQPLEAAVDRHPHVAEHAEGDVMRAEPLEVPEDAAADAEGAHGDHGAGDRDDAGVLRRSGQQEAGGRQQSDGATGRGRASGDGQHQAATQRPG